MRALAHLIMLLSQMYLSVISECHESLFKSAHAFPEQYRHILRLTAISGHFGPQLEGRCRAAERECHLQELMKQGCHAGERSA